MNNKFSWRAFISFGLTYATIVILLSGIMLYVSPPGRYAHWVNWKLLGFTKEGWQSIHTIFSFGFILLAIFHLFYINWGVFISYLKSKTTRGFNKKREFAISTLLVLIFFFGTVLSIPPFKSVMNLSENLTGSWEKSEERAPVAHAELLTLAELISQLNLSSMDEVTQKLDNHQIKFENVHSQTLQEIAVANNSTPMKIYEVIAKRAGNQRQGAGIGRKTLIDFANELNKSVNEIMATLKDNGIKAKSTETLRTIGENNNLPPRDVYKLISE